MTDLGRIVGAVHAAESRRGGTTKKQVLMTVNLRDQHFLDAIKAEADVLGISVSSFMRSMIRGYFGAALHGR